MNQIPNIEEELEKYFYSYFSIPDYDNLPTEIRLTKAKFLEKYKQLHHQQLQKARKEERERIEAIFKEHVPPHAMDLEDSVWLKRLLNKAFNHDKNV